MTIYHHGTRTTEINVPSSARGIVLSGSVRLFSSLKVGLAIDPKITILVRCKMTITDNEAAAESV